MKAALWTTALLELGISLFFMVAAIYNWPGPMFASLAELVYIIAMCISGLICITLVALGRLRLSAVVALVQPLCLVWAQWVYG